MNLLQKLAQRIEQAGTNTRGLVNTVLDPQHTVQPGHTYSPAVEAQNKAPIQNQYNAQGQPTYEVLGPPASPNQFAVRPPALNMGNPGSSYQLSGDDPVQVQGNDRNPQQGFGPQVQGVGSYPASLQPQRRYNQQQRQIGVPAQPMNNGLVAPIPQIHPQLLQQLSRLR